MVGQKGLTLLELSVSLGILSVLLACAYPALADWSKRIGFRSEVSSLVSSLHRAKLEAIKTNSYVVVEARPNGYSIFVKKSVAGKPSDWIRQPDERLLVDCTIKDGVTLTTKFRNPKDKMRFSGRPGINAGRFILTDAKGRRMDVVLSVSGRIRVE
jgi:prepilin-type N-terminal cleavage/methylation domain-containing protein